MHEESPGIAALLALPQDATLAELVVWQPETKYQEIKPPMNFDQEMEAFDEIDGSLENLRELHRSVSDALVGAHRRYLKATVQGRQADAEENARLAHYIEVLQHEQGRLEQEIKHLLAAKLAEQKAQLAELAIEAAGATGQAAPGQRNGLVKIRHPNRDFFLADLFDYALKDDGASMEAPIFTLSTKPDLSMWEWRSRDGNKHVKVTPSVLGRATQHDKDVLIFVVSQLTEALNRGREDAKNRTVRFTVHDFLVSTNRRTDGDEYKRLREAFERLRGTSITTDIRTGGERIMQGFGIIDGWRIVLKSKIDERMVAVEVTLSEWLYNAVQAFEVLTIHPDYFRLRKPLARRLYELARKHCGHQAQWSIDLALLKAKAGSKSILNKFRYAVRTIEADNILPEYRFSLGADDKVTFYIRDTRRLARSLAKQDTT